jgi:hypothetical protein
MKEVEEAAIKKKKKKHSKLHLGREALKRHAFEKKSLKMEKK